MITEAYSVIVWCWHDRHTDTIRLRMIRVDTEEEVRLREGAFILRILIDEDASMVRCYIRHIVSGREVYVQSGSLLRAFVKDCILDDNGSSSVSP